MLWETLNRRLYDSQFFAFVNTWFDGILFFFASSLLLFIKYIYSLIHKLFENPAFLEIFVI